MRTLSGNNFTALALAEETRRREQAIYSAADALVAVSEPDAEELRRLAPDVPRFVISNIHAPVGPTPDFDARQGLIFVGSFPHIPNVDAVLDFHRSTWPLVRRALPAPRLTVVGTKPPDSVLALQSPEVEVTGWVPEVAPYADRARVSIAPLRYGAGVKGKIGEALSRGLPVVTTSIGAEGMDLRDGEHALVADRAEDFAAAIARVHEDRDLWERLSRAGRTHIESRLGLDAARADVLRLLAGVVNTPFVTPADGTEAERAIKTFTSAFASGDRASLILTVPEGDHAAAESAFDQAFRTLAAEGLEPDTVADIQIAATAPDAVLPARAVIIGDGDAVAGRAVNAGVPAQRWRELATVAPARRRARMTPSAAVVLHAHNDTQALLAQLEAVRAADLPDRADLVVAADMPGREMQALLDSLGDVRVIRGTIPLGRHQAWQLGAMASDAPYVVALAPLAIPAPGFVQALTRALRAGAAVAGPRVAGAAGLRVAADGSLWPRAHDHDGELDALELDCLALPRELITEGLPPFPRGEGHVERQLAAWAAQHGRLELAGEALVERMPAPPASVIVCTRNRADELPDGIALLLKSGASEIIIVDNDSTDDTPAVAAELAERSGDVVRVVHEPRGGLSHARNAGAAAARHNLLVYVDDDARPAPGWLNHIVRTLARPGVVNAGGPISALWPEQRPADWPGRANEALLSVLDLGDSELVLPSAALRLRRQLGDPPRRAPRRRWLRSGVRIRSRRSHRR